MKIEIAYTMNVYPFYLAIRFQSNRKIEIGLRNGKKNISFNLFGSIQHFYTEGSMKEINRE